ncbi:MAG TPA: autotransporter assembly complex family protein [Geminicoccaceae bacterium]
MPEAGARRRAAALAGAAVVGWSVVGIAQISDDDDRPAVEDQVPPAAAGEPPRPEAERPEAERPPEVPYRARIEGDLEAPLRELLEQVSESRRMTDQPPSSLARLQRRAEGDLARLREALRSRGYYDSTVGLRIEREAAPVEVIFEVEPGPLYTFGEVAIDTGPEPTDLRLPEPPALGVTPGEPAAARAVLDAQQRLLERVKAQGFVLAETTSPRVIVDHDRRTMDVTFNLRPGPHARFGPVVVEGLETVEQARVDRRLAWETGELITPEKIEEARRRLVETGLFRRVEITPEAPEGGATEVPVRVRLTERKHRSVGLGVRYRTDEGPGGNVFLEHRNLFGRGETGTVELDGSGIGFSLSGSFKKPDFYRLNQAFIADTEFRYDDTDAFESTSASASAGIEREFRAGLVGRAALAFRYVKIQDVEEGDEGPFGLLSLPLGLTWDTSDDLFDPTEGGRLFVEEEPFVDVLDPGLTFNKALIGYSHYVKLVDQPRLIFAARAAFGSIVGADRADVPADERFYAGGGGSVRGFGFQKAGELDEDGDPVGGRSLLELAGEFRINLTETIGAVAFVDSGAAFEAPLPDFSEDLRFGAGAGLRYFSPIGPLRLDVGVPINRRDEDDAFQIYLSIGQAF